MSEKISAPVCTLLVLCAVAAYSVPLRAQTFSIPTNTWVVRSNPVWPASPSPDPLTSPGSKHVRATYDSNLHKIYYWGGDYCVPYTGYDRCASHEELWSYDVAANQWQVLLSQAMANVNGFPRGRCVSAFTYDSARRVIWMQDGDERYASPPFYFPGLLSGGVWAFNPATLQWIKTGPGTGVGGTSSVVSTVLKNFIYYPAGDVLVGFSRGVLVGGVDAGPVVKYSLAGIPNPPVAANLDNWSAASFPTADANMGDLMLAFDTRRNRLIAYLPFWDSITGTSHGQTWALDLATGTGTLLSTQNLPAVSVFGLVYDSAIDAVVLFGGYNIDDPGVPMQANALNQLWVLNLTTNTWTQMTFGGSVPSPRKGESITYDSFNDVIVVWGGTGDWQPSGVPDVYGYNGNETFLLRISGPIASTTPTEPLLIASLLPTSPLLPSLTSPPLPLLALPPLAPAVFSTGWTRVTGTALLTGCLPDMTNCTFCPPFQPDLYATEGCSAVIADWSSGIADTQNNRLLLWGGGHTGYYGNELYEFTVADSKLRRLNAPTTPVAPHIAPVGTPQPVSPGGCIAAIPPDCTGLNCKPNSRHTYQAGMVYIPPSLNRSPLMFVFSGGVACDAGDWGFGDTWFLDLNTVTSTCAPNCIASWTRRPFKGDEPSGTGFGSIAAYDPNSGKVFFGDLNNLFSYNAFAFVNPTDTYTLLNSAPLNDRTMAVIDPKRKVLFIFGGLDLLPGGGAFKINIAPGSSYVMTDIRAQLSGCDLLLNASSPGLVYDSVIDRIVGWPNFGNTVYLFNPDTNSCTTQMFPNGPPDSNHQQLNPPVPNSNGTFGRFAYFPALNLFAVINDPTNDAYILALQ